MHPPFPKRPKRLDRVFQTYDPPLYYVTFCSYNRRPILANQDVLETMNRFGTRNEPRGIALGRFVLMPDHVHLFLRLQRDLTVGTTIRLLKRGLSAALKSALPHWQDGFFDHVLRNSESYGEKWNYVRNNPVEAGLVDVAEEWPYQGEIVRIDRI